MYVLSGALSRRKKMRNWRVELLGGVRNSFPEIGIGFYRCARKNTRAPNEEYVSLVYDHISPQFGVCYDKSSDRVVESI